MATATRSKSRKRYQGSAGARAPQKTDVVSKSAPPSSAPTGAPAPTKKSPWILGRWLDLLLFVGTPAVLIPVFSAAQRRWSAQDIFMFVAAFGAMGHHLPGMIRAYGDKALFRRFRVRFIVAPIALLAVCIWSSFYNVQAVQLVALAWGIWHGLMQTYGFARIYDSKASPSAAARARADFALCVAWFVAAVLLSPLRFRSALELYYDSGGPVIASWAFNVARIAVIAVLALVTAVFFWRHWTDARAGRGISSVKLLLLASSIGFWWYCNNGVHNILVGIALFEVFHDVQYLSIVWIYNRARVERDESIRGFMRFVFRRSGSLMGVYVGLVMAYGAIALLSNGVSADAIRHTLVGIVTASALLHFYYDGFIWKVRETETRSHLGIDGSGLTNSVPARRLPPWTMHGLRWAALVIPFAALCAAQLMGRVVPPIEKYHKVAEVVPEDAQAQLNYGIALQDNNQLEQAITRFRAALSLNPKLAEAEAKLGSALSLGGYLDAAV
ncbi:MAG TPA: hypothetical protein VG095_03260, partial [Chthoniobacterales bacterium]|nr:hypothetical protein [Chthoniobacterales bacterium]